MGATFPSGEEEMNLKNMRLACGALLLACFALTPFAQAQPAAATANRVIMQVSDGEPGKWNLALNNARNLQADLGASNVQIEIVAYGPGLGMLKRDSTVAARVDEAVASGVKIVACENTMKGQKLTQADMLPSVGYVGAGVVEIMQRQQQGWAYLRP
jgi:intracellular sulfur oxidation DsrE/DsrF family protein